jgi:Helicase associated domain
LRWVSRQKEDYHASKLDQGKIDVLEELGFDWTLDPPATWDNLHQELVQYHERFGSTFFNKRINKELALWTEELRRLHKRGDLDPKWVAKLNSLGFQWEAEDVDWNAMFDRLVAYKKRHGTVLVPNRCTEDPPLGPWVYRQREAYTKYTKGRPLSDVGVLQHIAQSKGSPRIPAEIHMSRLSKLVEIGFEFDPLEAQWLEMYDMLLGYKMEHGSLNVPASFPILGRWVLNQRTESRVTKKGKTFWIKLGLNGNLLKQIGRKCLRGFASINCSLEIQMCLEDTKRTQNLLHGSARNASVTNDSLFQRIEWRSWSPLGLSGDELTKVLEA